MRVKELLTPRQKRLADFWEGMEGTALPAGIWNQVVLAYLRDKELSVPRQARASSTSPWPTRAERSGTPST